MKKFSLSILFGIADKQYFNTHTNKKGTSDSNVVK